MTNPRAIALIGIVNVSMITGIGILLIAAAEGIQWFAMWRQAKRDG